MPETGERQHVTGKNYGYETDGTNYWLPPSLADMAAAISDEVAALDAIVATVVKAVGESRRHLAARQRKWWMMIYSELGLDLSREYAYLTREGKLTPKSKNEVPDNA